MMSAAGIAITKYAIQYAESINADCKSSNWQAFFKSGINVGKRFDVSAHRKKSVITKTSASPVLLV